VLKWNDKRPASAAVQTIHNPTWQKAERQIEVVCSSDKKIGDTKEASFKESDTSKVSTFLSDRNKKRK
jgi:hypothetical protein